MVKKLRSIWKNQKSSLALKLLLVLAALLWYRQGFDMTPGFLFAGLYWFWYFYPAINNKKFLASTAVNFLLALFVPVFPDPRLNVLMLLVLVAVYGILLGVKNLVFLKRDLFYYFGQFLLTAIFSLFILFGRLDFLNEIIIGAGLTLLFREFYVFLAPEKRDLATLSALISSYLALQLGWVISLVPKSIWPKVGLLTLLVFMIVEITAHYLQGKLISRNLKRDLVIAFIGITTLFLF